MPLEVNIIALNPWLTLIISSVVVRIGNITRISIDADSIAYAKTGTWNTATFGVCTAKTAARKPMELRTAFRLFTVRLSSYRLVFVSGANILPRSGVQVN